MLFRWGPASYTDHFKKHPGQFPGCCFRLSTPKKTQPAHFQVLNCWLNAGGCQLAREQACPEPNKHGRVFLFRDPTRLKASPLHPTYYYGYYYCCCCRYCCSYHNRCNLVVLLLHCYTATTSNVITTACSVATIATTATTVVATAAATMLFSYTMPLPLLLLLRCCYRYCCFAKKRR